MLAGSLLLAGGLGLPAPADVIPGQAPETLVLHSEVREGLRLRGDFEVSTRVLLSYSSIWPRTTARIAEQVLASGAQLALVHEGDSSTATVERWLARLGKVDRARVEIHTPTIDTPWVRDWGPLQLVGRNGAIWVDSSLEGGDSIRRADEGAPRWLAQHHEVELEDLAWTLDGGAFISNGQGFCVLTGEYLSRVLPAGTAAESADARALLGALGCRVSAIVPTLIDEQTKHADMIAQFVSPTRLMLAEIIEPGAWGPSEDSLRLEAAARGIARAARSAQIDLDVVRIPTPATREGQNPRSYVNGLHLADRYLMPSYPALGSSSEAAALAAVQRALGSVPVVALDSSELIAAGGAIHCASLGLFTD